MCQRGQDVLQIRVGQFGLCPDMFRGEVGLATASSSEAQSPEIVSKRISGCWSLSIMVLFSESAKNALVEDARRQADLIFVRTANPRAH